MSERMVKDKIYKNHRIIVSRVEGAMSISCNPGYWYFGYVEIPKGSKFYGKDYRDIDTEFDVHGGLSFSGEIGRLTFNGKLEDVEGYFLGFDCAHVDDHPYVQDANYTLSECKRLVDQIEVGE